MKRSEILNIIMTTFEHEGKGNQMEYKVAESILKALEKVGMYPPLMNGHGTEEFMEKHGDITEFEALKWDKE
jgi:hypothetical protein